MTHHNHGVQGSTGTTPSVRVQEPSDVGGTYHVKEYFYRGLELRSVSDILTGYWHLYNVCGFSLGKMPLGVKHDRSKSIFMIKI